MTQGLPRALAALIALIAFAAVLVQFFVVNAARPEMADLGHRAWSMLRYFTILTNILAGATFAAIALGRAPSARFVASVVLSISMVGIVYHTLLAPETPLPGWEYWTDLGYHTLVPSGSVLWWTLWGDKRVRLADLPWWLSWPLGYCVWALIRGQVEGRYPYFFFDLDRFGAGVVAGYIAGLVVAFALMGLVLLVIARLSGAPRRA